MDADQNWNGITFSEVNGFTTVVASRALKTGDVRDRDITVIQRPRPKTTFIAYVRILVGYISCGGAS